MQSKITMGLVLAGSLVATGAEAAIDKVKSVNLSPSQFAQTPIIQVVNDGHEFTQVQGTTTYSASASAECKGANKIQTQSFGLGQYTITGGLNEYAPHAVYSDSWNGGGKSWSGGVSVEVPADKAHLGGVGVYTDPVALCNVMKDNKVEGGQAGWDVLKNGFETQITKKISYAVRCQFDNVGSDIVYWEQKTIEVPAVLQCEGNPSVTGPMGGAPMNLTTSFQINDAELEVEDEVEGYCVTGFEFPVGVKIQSNGMVGDASFRLGKDGLWGGVTNLHFTEEDTTFEHEVMVNVPPADMGADGDLNQFQGNGGGSNGPIDGFASNGPKVHELKLAILEPHAKVWDTKTVKVKCGGPTLNPAIGHLPGQMTIEPRDTGLPQQAVPGKTMVAPGKATVKPMVVPGKATVKPMVVPGKATLKQPAPGKTAPKRRRVGTKAAPSGEAQIELEPAQVMQFQFSPPAPPERTKKLQR